MGFMGSTTAPEQLSIDSSDMETDRKTGGDHSVPEIMAVVGGKMSNETRQVLFVGRQIRFSDVEADK